MTTADKIKKMCEFDALALSDWCDQQHALSGYWPTRREAASWQYARLRPILQLVPEMTEFIEKCMGWSATMVSAQQHEIIKKLKLIAESGEDK